MARWIIVFIGLILLFLYLSFLHSASRTPPDPIENRMVLDFPGVYLHFQGKQWNLGVELIGCYDETAEKWNNQAMYVSSSNDCYCDSKIKSRFNLKVIGDVANFKLITISDYFFLLDFNDKKPPITEEFEQIPDAIANYSHLQLGSKWKVLKGELRFSIFKLSEKKLECSFRLDSCGLTLFPGPTVEAKQSGTITLYLATIRGCDNWVQTLIDFGSWTATSKDRLTQTCWLKRKNRHPQDNLEMFTRGNLPGYFDNVMSFTRHCSRGYK